MAQYELTRDQLGYIIDAAENAGLELRTGYSGRGMYGKTCIGVVGYVSDLIAFVLEVAEWDRELAQDELTQVSSDGMGTSTIYYWPRLTVAKDDQE